MSLRRIPPLSGKIDHTIRGVSEKVGSALPSSVIRTADIEIDLQHRSVRKAGVLLALLESEWTILASLAGNAGSVMKIDRLQQITGKSETSIRSCVAVLRRRLEDDPKRPDIILTVPYGFQFRKLEP